MIAVFTHLANQEAVKGLDLSAGREEELWKFQVPWVGSFQTDLTKEACPVSQFRGENPKIQKMDNNGYTGTEIDSSDPGKAHIMFDWALEHRSTGRIHNRMKLTESCIVPSESAVLSMFVM